MPSSVKFKLVTLHCEVKMDIKMKINSVDDLRKYYPDQFERIGEFPSTYHIILNEEAQAVIHAPRKCSIHVRDELEKELTKMEKEGVICKVSEPTNWVSSLVMLWKSNRKLRICLDPKDLNKACCHHKTPTLDETTHKYAEAQFFSKLDAKNGYWAVKLDDESSLHHLQQSLCQVLFSTHAIRAGHEPGRVPTENESVPRAIPRNSWYS